MPTAAWPRLPVLFEQLSILGIQATLGEAGRDGAQQPPRPPPIGGVGVSVGLTGEALSFIFAM